MWLPGTQGAIVYWPSVDTATARAPPAEGPRWRSTDGGATWQLSLSVPPWSGQAADYVRIYFCAAIDGELHVQPHALYAATVRSGASDANRTSTSLVFP